MLAPNMNKTPLLRVAATRWITVQQI